MTIETAVIELILSLQAVTDLIEERARKHRGELEIELPYLTVTEISHRRPYHMLGESGTHRSRVQLSCHAATTASLDALTEALTRKTDDEEAPGLSGYSGPAGDLWIEGLFIENLTTQEPDTKTASTVPAESKAIDLMVHYRRHTSSGSSS